MRRSFVRRCIVSTLSEIAANHAMNAKTQEAETVMSKPYSPVLRVFEAAPDTQEQVPLHTLASIVENAENKCGQSNHY
jgi:hypothetical protein